ncbi:MAG: hypothetical protein ACTJG4_15380 [Vreelandella alkaliphila]|uniref:hypothetical protein n=1 Tax=Halomonadaceae TaxID=28256 RepID=UPI003F9B3795
MRIDDMSIDQLLELNQYICRRIDELRDRENLQALSQPESDLREPGRPRAGDCHQDQPQERDRAG